MSYLENHPESVLIFDMNETLLDLKKVRASVAKMLGGNEDTVSLWFETMLHYSLVDTVSEQYHHFGEIGAAALMILAKNRNMALSKEEAQKTLQSIRSSPPFPEVPGALEQLKENGFRMAVLTNSSKEGMDAQLENAGIKHFFNICLSVEEIGVYKPHKKVYQWAARQLQVPGKNGLLVAAHGWDAAGAMAGGMQAAFISRPGRSLYPLAPEPTFIESDLKALADKLVR